MTTGKKPFVDLPPPWCEAHGDTLNKDWVCWKCETEEKNLKRFVILVAVLFSLMLVAMVAVAIFAPAEHTQSKPKATQCP